MQLVNCRFASLLQIPHEQIRNFKICPDLNECLTDTIRNNRLAVAAPRKHVLHSPLQFDRYFYCFAENESIQRYSTAFFCDRIVDGRTPWAFWTNQSLHSADTGRRSFVAMDVRGTNAAKNTNAGGCRNCTDDFRSYFFAIIPLRDIECDGHFCIWLRIGCERKV